MDDLAVLNPVAKPAGYDFKLAERVKDLKGITIGLIWNGKHGGNVALRMVAENLGKKLGYKLTTLEMKDDFPFAPSFIEKVAAACQAVIASTGD